MMDDSKLSDAELLALVSAGNADAAAFSHRR